MSDMLTRIVEGLKEIFPDIEDMEITPETALGDIPDWDSMSAVNFQSFIELNFQVSVPQDVLNEETAIAEVIGFIQSPEKIGATA